MTQTIGFYIGNFFIAYYGAMIVLGLAAASLVGWLQVRRYGKNFDDFILIAAIGGLCGIIGAKLLYLIVSFDNIDWGRLTEPGYFSSLMMGGFVFYGGLIGGLIGLAICRKCLRIDVLSYLEIGIVCLPIVHGFGRIGCSLVGCCYGMPYDGPGSILYQASPFAPNLQPLFPVQLLEATLNFMIAAVLLLLQKKLTGTKSLELYLILYGIMRFILELFRYDAAERGMLWGISTSQLISLLLILGTILFHFRKKIRSSAI